jgi:hypothetical protein
MDSNDRQPRQTPSGYAGQQGTLLPSQAQYPVVSASDRFRQPALTAAPPTSAPAGSRAGSQSYGYAYDGGSQFVGSPIPPAYGAQDYTADQAHQHQHTHQQRASQYPQYDQTVMYNVAGAQATPAGQSQYGAVPQYQHSQHSHSQSRDSAMEVLGTGFGAVAQAHYYGVPGQEGPTSAPASALAPPSVPSQYPSVPSLGYTAQPQPQQQDRPSLAPPSYSQAGMSDPHQPTASAAYAQTGAGYADPSAQQRNEYDDFYNNYQLELKKTFEYVRDGRLSEAATLLYRVSDWLLHWAETLGKLADSVRRERAAELTLGLVRDDENNYQQRLKLWEEFNNCWLTLLQKQKEMMAAVVSTGQRPQPPQTLVEPDFLEKMGDQVVKNCDSIEKHGLVDYQMGVWEEEIIASQYRPLHVECAFDLA